MSIAGKQQPGASSSRIGMAACDGDLPDRCVQPCSEHLVGVRVPAQASQADGCEVDFGQGAGQRQLEGRRDVVEICLDR